MPPKKVGFVKSIILGIGAEFRESPLKFSSAIFLMCLGIYIFIGDIHFKAEDGDRKIELHTKDKK